MSRTKGKSSSSVSPKRQIKLSTDKTPKVSKVKISFPVAPKKVEKGRMAVDNEQMLKDLIELGRIHDSDNDHKSKNKKKNYTKSSFMDFSNSSFANFIQNRNHGPYFNVAIGFLVLAFVFFMSIIYIVNSKAVININLKKVDNISQIQRSFNVYDYSELSKTNNSAIIVSAPIVVSVDDSYSVSTSIVKLKKAEGKIKVVNNSNQPQGLISTTRFISDATGDLYRLKDTVNVPANSSAEVAIVADKETNGGEVSGVRFSIPGLKSDELRKIIYGESTSAIGFDGVAKAVVTTDDINKATNFLELKLRQEALNELNNQFAKYPNFIMIPDSLDFKLSSSIINAKEGVETDSFKISGKANANALFINTSKLLNVIKSDILSKNYSGNIVKIKDGSLSYSLSKMDLVNNIASLNISVNSFVSYDLDKIINRDDIAGMSIDDFYVYAQDKNFANKIQVVSYPFWKTHLPKISDNIIIRVK